jgi:dolichol-phosphate mannosyltransferase
LRIKEVGVPRLYLDPNRAFGGVLDDAGERLEYYRRVIDEAAFRCPLSAYLCPPTFTAESRCPETDCG